MAFPVYTNLQMRFLYKNLAMFFSKYWESKIICNISWGVIPTASVRDLLQFQAWVGVVKWSNLL